MIIFLTFCLSGCGAPNQTELTHPDFSVQYICTNGYHSRTKYPIITVIHSSSKLDAYYARNKDLYDLEHNENPASDYTIGFLDSADTYDNNFFASNVLVLVLLEEPSGSNRHAVKDIYADPTSLNILVE